MRLAYVLIGLLAATGCRHDEPDQLRMANLHLYVGIWQNEVSSTRLEIWPDTDVGGVARNLFLAEGDGWLHATEGGCFHQDVLLTGNQGDWSFWDCSYVPTGQTDLGFDSIRQRAYLARGFRVDELPEFQDGQLFVNRAVRDGIETLTYEYWSLPQDGQFTDTTWSLGQDGSLHPQQQGRWIQIEEE